MGIIDIVVFVLFIIAVISVGLIKSKSDLLIMRARKIIF